VLKIRAHLHQATYVHPALTITTTHTLAHASLQALIPGVEAVLAVAAATDVPREVPSLFTCPLTLEVFREPVITPAGHSYERAALMEHLSKVGGIYACMS
jgi:hypothetical protein